MRAWTRQPLRNHWQFVVIVLPLILLMTWPASARLFDGGQFWVPAQDYDAWMKFWDAWRLDTVLRGQADFFHTKSVYYPQGTTLAFQPTAVPHALLMVALKTIMPASNAYTLLYLLIIFVCALSAYVYAAWLFKDKWLAVIAAVVFGCSQWVMGKPSQPDLQLVATLPLSLYCLHRGIVESSAKRMAVAGVLIGATVWISLYTFVCALLTAGFLALWLARSRWRQRQYWQRLGLMALMISLCSGVRVGVMLADTSSLDSAIRARLGSESSVDALSSFINYRHPLLSPVFHAAFDLPPVDLSATDVNFIHGRVHVGYLGYLTLLLIGYGLLRPESRRRMLPWLLLLIGFLVLRLGSALRLNDQIYAEILLPKHALNQLLPDVFSAFKVTDHFQIGVLLPLAILACIGLGALLAAVSARRRRLVIAGMALLIAFDTWYLPLETEIDADEFAYIAWLKRQDDQASIALAHLPIMAGEWRAKIHLLHQSRHGYPQAGGYVSRTRYMPANYRYIKANPLLAAWLENDAAFCQPSQQSAHQSALDQLIADGLSHVVLHRHRPDWMRFESAFAMIAPVYSDRHAIVLRLTDMRDHCAASDEQRGVVRLYHAFFDAGLSPRYEPLLSQHGGEPMTENGLRHAASRAWGWQSVNHVWRGADGETMLQSSDASAMDLASFIERNDSLWLLSHPRDADGDWLLEHYHLCQRALATDIIIADHYLRRSMPCELVSGEPSVQATYDNGSQLRDSLFEVEDSDLRIYLHWSHARSQGEAYSIQLFDAQGERVAQLDATRPREPLTSHHIDIAGLAPANTARS